MCTMMPDGTMKPCNGKFLPTLNYKSTFKGQTYVLVRSVPMRDKRNKPRK